MRTSIRGIETERRTFILPDDVADEIDRMIIVERKRADAMKSNAFARGLILGGGCGPLIVVLLLGITGLI